MLYYPYLELARGEGKGLLASVSPNAPLSSSPTTSPLVLPQDGRGRGARKLEVRLEAVDGNGLLPLRAVDAVFPTAYAFRRAFQRVVPEHLSDRPERDPLAGPLAASAHAPRRVFSALAAAANGWRRAPMARFPIDHSVGADGDAQAAPVRCPDTTA